MIILAENKKLDRGKMMKITKKDTILNFFCKPGLPFFPLFIAILACLFLFLFIESHRYLFLLLAFISPYIIPLFSFKLLQAIYPIKEGASFFGEERFSPWVSSFRLQQIYVMFPVLERILFFIPGLYNSWLRAWGSKIGKNVYFLPGILIVDRAHIEIGDNVMIGNQCYFSPHVVQIKKGRFFLYYKKISIGNNVFIGAFSTLGPGTKIADNITVPAGSAFGVNQSTPTSYHSS